MNEHEVFSDSWACALGDALKESSTYRRAALRWEGALVFELATDDGDDDGPAAYFDLWHGECRAARAATAGDREQAPYVIRGNEAMWRKVLAGKMKPIWGLMSGRLSLVRGSLASLVPHTAAAAALVETAATLGTRFPDGTPSVPTGETIAAPPRPSSPEAAPSPDHDSRTFQTTSTRGLDHSLPPMRLWRKAKRDGIWDPAAIDFHRDAEDWQRLDTVEREVLLHLASLFQAGEESVTLDLLPLIQVIAAEGRLEEEMFLAAFLWEEAKHVELFRRFFDEIAGERSDLARFHGEHYRRIFYDALPNAMSRLRDDASPVAQAEASTTYNMIVEGVLAETGYHAYHEILVANDLMPGMQRAVGYLKADESRHLAYGVFLLSRLVAEHGRDVWDAIEARMTELLPSAIGSVTETFDRYPVMPFGLRLEQFTDFATSQFQRRMRRIERANHQTLEQIYATDRSVARPS